MRISNGEECAICERTLCSDIKFHAIVSGEMSYDDTGWTDDETLRAICSRCSNDFEIAILKLKIKKREKDGA